MINYNVKYIGSEAVAQFYALQGMNYSQEDCVRLEEWYDELRDKLLTPFSPVKYKRKGRTFNYTEKITNKESEVELTWQDKILMEIFNHFEEARHYSMLSSDFRDRIWTALSLGSAYIDRFITHGDPDGYFGGFLEKLVYICGMIVGFMLTTSLESKEERMKISIDDFEKDFEMDVYGIFPTRFWNNGILVIGVVRTGKIEVGHCVGMPIYFKEKDYGHDLDAELNSVGEVLESYMFGQKFAEVKAGDVCVLSVQFRGQPYHDEYWPLTIHETSKGTDIREASIEEREMEYAHQYLCYKGMDMSTLKLPYSDREYMKSVQRELGILENRARQLEMDCISELLTKRDLTCFEAVKKCVMEIENKE